ncbi:MAG: monovalent cation/H+ antiporter complex subunit F [Pigmentiphaga sp.]|nr:monovalent cation/H+ antiporter complex subunit F [Pigmentiphaga sp.]
MTLVFWAGVFAAILLVPAVAMVAWRLLAGPSSADRAIATDLLGLLGIAIAAVAATLGGQAAYLDIAVGIALFGFLGAVAFASLLERARIPEGRSNASDAIARDTGPETSGTAAGDSRRTAQPPR